MGARTRVSEYMQKLTVASASGDEEGLAEAASDVAIMVQFSEFTRTQMVQEGAISGLLALISEGTHTPEVCTHAVSALTSLCSGGYPDVIEATPRAVRERIAAEGGISALMLMLNEYGTRLNTAGTLKRESASQLKLYAKAAEAITALCEDSEANVEAFIAEGALLPLVALGALARGSG